MHGKFTERNGYQLSGTSGGDMLMLLWRRLLHAMWLVHWYAQYYDSDTILFSLPRIAAKPNIELTLLYQLEHQ
jgi:hypothetical protein